MNECDATARTVYGTEDSVAEDARPTPSRVPFCPQCHRIASHRQDACCWCGATELVMYTFDDISAHFQGLIGDWILAGKQAETA